MYDIFGRPLEQTSRLYTIAEDPDAFSSVKMEADDNVFIQDNSHQMGSSPPAPFAHLVPPTEVPLRATGANKEMRKMMSVFRLNPFSIHHGGGRGVSDTSWNGGEAGPLTEEPKYIEYQLNGFYSSEESETGSYGGSPGPSLELLDGYQRSTSPWAGSEENFDSSLGWQEPDWSLHASHSLPLDMGDPLMFDYPSATSMRMLCRLFTLSNCCFVFILFFSTTGISRGAFGCAPIANGVPIQKFFCVIFCRFLCLSGKPPSLSTHPLIDSLSTTAIKSVACERGLLIPGLQPQQGAEAHQGQLRSSKST